MTDTPTSLVHPIYRAHLRTEVESYDPKIYNLPIPERFEKQVTKTPDCLLIKQGNVQITFNEFNKQANQLARMILAEAGSKEETVALLFEHGGASILAIMGVLKAGKIYIPLDSDYPKNQLAYALSDSTATLLVTNTANLPLARQLSGGSCRIINLDALDTNLATDNLNLSLSPDYPVAIYYTSGSTGQSKGVLKNHRNLTHRLWAYEPGDRLSHLFSYSFTASLDPLYGGLFRGATICPYNLKTEGLGHLAEWLIEEKITSLHLPISILRDFLDLLSNNDIFPAIKQMRFSGEPLYRKDFDNIKKHLNPTCIIKNILASAEAEQVAQLIIEPGMALEDDIIPVGYEVFDKKILILDEDGVELGPNQIGEIAVKSAYLFKEYWKKPEQTRKRLLPDPQNSDEFLFLTNDLGLKHPDGLIEHRGRKDFQVKIHGYLIDLPAVEAAIQNISLVKEAVVIAREDIPGEKQLVAYYVPTVQPGPKPEALRKILSKGFPDYMIPAHFVSLETFPKTPSGKFDRRALPELSYRRTDLDISYQPPRDAVEKKLCKIWAQVLGYDQVGIADNFFDLGGSSLQAMRLFVQIERVIGKKLPLALILKASSVAQQAQILRQEEFLSEWTSLVPVQPNGSAPPLFCFPGVGGNVLTFHDLSRHMGKDLPLYALQSRGLGGSEKPLTRIEEIAAYHIEEMKTVQPTGPYFMCGSSFGGMVAYEAAQQLHDRGEAVALVALFDTAGPIYPKKLPGITRGRRRLYNFLQDIEKHAQNLRAIDWSARWGYLSFRLGSASRRLEREIKNKYEEIRYPLPKNLREVRKANRRATKYAYAPPRFTGRLVLFRASEQPFGVVPDPLLGWGKIAGQRIEVIEVTGYHDTLLWEPRVGEVAKSLQKVLAETQSVINK
jgi:acyl-coenzyme A synthetase/AMP-(fatty) acid ligase/thioesterase domain-containing protein/acyl carrier protein